MNKIVILTCLLLAPFVCTVPGIAQNNFTSGEGGFAIDLPREGVTVEDTPEAEAGLGTGKKYIWKMPDRVFIVAFYLMTEDKPLTPKFRDNILAGFKEGVVGSARKDNYQVTEKPFLFKGNKGSEFRIVYPTGVSVIRYYATLTRFFMMQTTVRGAAPEVESAAVKALGSFRILDAAELKKVKIEEATPEPLPQEPRVRRLTTDAQDARLKGNVKSIIEDFVNLPGTRREWSEEAYYSEAGDLTRKLEYLSGFPQSVTTWGNVGGSRVSKTIHIYFAADQRSADFPQVIRESTEEEREGPSPDRDTRYSVRYENNYDDKGRLSEILIFQNNGKPIGATTFKYSDNKRERILSRQNREWSSRSMEFFDPAGNLIEEHWFDEAGKPSDRQVNKLEFDPAGNWIVKRTFEKNTVRGRTMLKPLWITYRTITYYP